MNDPIAAVANTPLLADFPELAASRIRWIQEVLKPWCASAARKQLLLAELEWVDLAGKVDPTKTLWAWAWSRFPELVHAELGIDESAEIVLQLRDGTRIRGYPDARRSQQGQLHLLASDGGCDLGPYSMDDIVQVCRSQSDESHFL